MSPEQLQRLSTLLDEALDLDVQQRARWLDALGRREAELSATLRNVLARGAAGETGELLARGPGFAVPEVRDHAAGERIGPYRLLRVLGAGGMGEVWLAERADGSFMRQVALKLPVVGARRSVLVQRFARERDILAGLEHPLIARLYEAGVADDGRPYLAIEYVEGEPIDRWCRERALPTAERVRLLLQVADAVAYAHSRLVLHRDLKPGNVLVTREGQVRLLDFGIAKLIEDPLAAAGSTALTQAAGRVYSRDYASPEQVAGQPLGTTSDLYSLGVLAYVVLAGTPPYRLERDTPAAVEEAILSAEVAAPSRATTDPAAARALRGDLDAIVLRALRKNPAERYPSVEAFAHDLRRHLDGLRVLARPDTLVYRALRLVRRHRWPLAAAAAFAAVLGLALGSGATAAVLATMGAGLATALWQAQRARAHARRAETQARTAQAVQRFLLELFAANRAEQPDPVAASTLTARELLDRGAAQIDRALADAPEAREQVLGLLARMYAGLSLLHVTADLQRRRIALLAELERARGDDREARIAAAWLDLADTEGARSRLQAAGEALDTALAILQRRGDQASLLWGRALDARAMLALLRDEPQGLEWAERAVQVLRRHPVSRERVQALHSLSHVLSGAGRSDEAQAAIEEGLRDALALGDAGVALADELHRAWARVQVERGDVAAGEARQRELLASLVARRGAGSLPALTAAGELGSALFLRGEVMQGEVVLRPAAAAALERLDRGESDWVSPLVVGYHAAARASLGELDEAAALFERLPVHRDGPRDFPRPALWRRLACLRAEIALWRGDVALAQDLVHAAALEMQRLPLVGTEAQERLWAIELMLAQASGDGARIQALEPQIASATTNALPGQAPPLARWPLRAEVAEALGDLARAATWAQEGLARVEATRAQVHRADIERRLRAVWGSALHAAGREEAALEQLGLAMALLTGRLDAERSPQALDLRRRLQAVRE